MSLDAGGHLTHGAAQPFGQVVQRHPVRRAQGRRLLDYDQVEALAHEHKPTIIIAGGSAYSRQFDFARFRAIADSVGAILLVDMAHFAGLVAGGSTPARSRMPMWRPRPRTRPCAARAAA
jgi:glycine hydroxymethyltransferase